MPETNTQPVLADDLEEMHRLKQEAEKIGRDKTAADAAFKEKMAYCLRRMIAEKAKSHRSDESGVLFTRVEDRVKGQVDDKRLFVRWALEQDEGIQEFLYTHGPADEPEWVEAFYEAITNTTFVSYSPNQTACNSMAKAHVDDKKPLPPGLNFRPDPYIQQLTS